MNSTESIFTAQVMEKMENIMSIEDFLRLKLILKKMSFSGAVRVVEYLINKLNVQRREYKFNS